MNLESTKQILNCIPKENPVEKNKEFEEWNKLQNELREYDNKVNKALEQKRRTYRIIEICELNQIQNEEWIRSLNYYKTNLQKAIKYIHGEINHMDKDVNNYTTMCENFIKNYNMGIKNLQRLLQNIENSILNQKVIDKSIKNTNDFIISAFLNNVK